MTTACFVKDGIEYQAIAWYKYKQWWAEIFLGDETIYWFEDPFTSLWEAWDAVEIYLEIGRD